MKEVFRATSQNGRHGIAVVSTDMYQVKTYGYARRSSRIRYYERGEEKNIPASVLLALGVLPNTPEPEEIPPPPAFDPAGMDMEAKGTLADALRKAGLA